MNYFKVGCNFDPDLLKGVILLNEQHDDAKINEMYGCLKEHAPYSARPKYRIPEASRNDIAKYIRTALDNGITFNYSLNSIYPGSKQFLHDNLSGISESLKWLYDSGVSTITISNPIMAEIILASPYTFNIEVSTIAHIDTITQIKYWKDKYSIQKICGNLLKNRSVKFLSHAARYCNENDIIYNVMVNEFCSIGSHAGRSYSTHCIYRDSCYLCHAENTTVREDGLFNSYPMNRCMDARLAPQDWLKCHFIRPEDVIRYNKIGINHFKITGRTADTNFILQVCDAYLTKKWNGNLLELWKQLESINRPPNDPNSKSPIIIKNPRLDGFLDHWFTPEGFDCAIELCGETCKYCDRWYKNNYFQLGK